MQTAIPNQDSASEATILARVLSGEQSPMPPEIARYILTLGFSEADKARMHDLAVRNQDDALAGGEHDRRESRALLFP